MLSRSVISLVLTSVLPVQVSYAQKEPCPPVGTEQVVREVVVSGAAFNDGYDGGICGIDGEIYRRRDNGRWTSVMRIARDGSTFLFTIPDNLSSAAIAPTSAGGLNIIAHRATYQMYRFDSHGKLLTQHEVSLVLNPMEMVVLPSGRTVVVGFRRPPATGTSPYIYGGAILDADDRVVRSFDFPPTPAGESWTPWMWGSVPQAIRAGAGVAYLILRSGPLSAIATITERGDIDVKAVPVPPNSSTRYHNEWLLGPGVAVEVYHDPSERPHPVLRFDEYDLSRGKKIASKSAPGTGFTFGCYSGREISMLAHSAHVDLARHLSKDTLRLVTSSLKVLN